MLVKDIMRTEFQKLYVPGSRDSALELIKKYNLKLIPILKKDTEKLLGTVSPIELIKNPDEEDLAILMNRNPITIQQDTDIKEAIKLITDTKNRIIVVLDGEQIVGLLTVHLIIKKILAKKNFKDPIKPFVKTGTISIWDGTPLQVALYIMQISNITVIPCIDDSGNLSGILSYEELMKESEVIVEEYASSLSATEDYEWSWGTADTLLITKKELQLPDKQVKDVMVKKGQIQVVNELSTIHDCANKMGKFLLDQLPVMNVNDKLLGMIYDIDLIKVLLNPDFKL
ncbi:MAG: CBS domain-containing protein [Candidatus Helarchaeota archaeon]